MEKFVTYLFTAMVIGITFLLKQFHPGAEMLIVGGSIAIGIIIICTFSIKKVLNLKRGVNEETNNHLSFAKYAIPGVIALFLYNLIGLNFVKPEVWQEIHNKIYGLIIFPGIVIYFGSLILQFVYQSRNQVKENDSKGISRARSYLGIAGLVMLTIIYVIYSKEIAPKEDKGEKILKEVYNRTIDAPEQNASIKSNDIQSSFPEKDTEVMKYEGVVIVKKGSIEPITQTGINASENMPSFKATIIHQQGGDVITYKCEFHANKNDVDFYMDNGTKSSITKHDFGKKLYFAILKNIFNVSDSQAPQKVHGLQK